MKRNNLRIYIHIPFCVKRCNYCSFVSYVGNNKEKISTYIDYLRYELKLYKKKKSLTPITIYLGGGTPSFLSVSQFKKLGEIIKENVDFSLLKEFTIEANPESITEEKVAIWKSYGIDRVSLGIQSFDDTLLSFLGRPHDVSTVERIIPILKKYFTNISFDLIYGIPEQTLKTWEHTLKRALYYEPSHISMYALSIDEGTPLFEKVSSGEVQPLDEDNYIKMYEIGVKLLKQYGYYRYEISNFCKNNMKSLHNLGYWTYEDYVGIGISASSFLDGKRYTNYSDFKNYMRSLKDEKLPIKEYDIINRKTKMAEYIILRLRTEEGLKKDEFKEIFGIYPDNIVREKFDYFISLGLMDRTPYGWKLKDRGILVSNTIFAELL